MFSGLPIWAIILLIVLLLVILWLAVAAALRRGEQTDGVKLLPQAAIATLFQRLSGRVDQQLGAAKKRYDVPWIVVLSEDRADALLLSQTPLPGSQQVSEDAPRDPHQPLAMIFDQGVVIGFSADSLGASDRPADEKRWEDFVGLAGSYRPYRPIDSIVVSLPASLLLQAQTPEGRAALELRASRASRRIGIAQNRYGIRLTAYLVVTGMEELPGFQALNCLPQDMRDSMLGWSSPYDPTQRFHTHWIGEAVSSLQASLLLLSTELACGHPPQAQTALLLLPKQIESLSWGLKTFTQQLMGSQTFHEPCFFRGLYFTGQHERPVFVKDLFTQKVFAEFGLSRAARSSQLARPIQGKVLRAVAIGFIGLWAIGLTYASFQIGRVFPTLAEGIEGLNRDAEHRAASQTDDATFGLDWRKKTAVSLVLGLEQLQMNRVSEVGADRSGIRINLFLPGSLPIFDPLLSQLQLRLEEEFKQVALETIRRSIYRKAAELTGVGFDPRTDALIYAPSECRPPLAQVSATDTAALRTLAIDQQPEYLRLVHYLRELVALDKSLSALKRLQAKSPTAEEDLRLVLRYALDKEFLGPLTDSTALFQASIQAVPQLIDASLISQVSQCGLAKVHQTLLIQLVERNPLLVSETKVREIEEDLLDKSEQTSAEILALITSFHLSLIEQQRLLQAGGGEWLSGPEPSLGQALESQTRLARTLGILGPGATEQMQLNTSRAASQLAGAIKDLVPPPGFPGLVISQEPGVAPVQNGSRKSLAASIEALRLQPFMVPVNTGVLVASPEAELIAWDAAGLSRASSIVGAYKRFLADELHRFPNAFQEPIQRRVSFQTSQKVDDILEVAHQSRAPNSSEPPIALEDYEATRTRLVSLANDLNAMGDSQASATIMAMLASDARTRLIDLQGSFLQLSAYSLIGLPQLGENLGTALLPFDAAALQDYLGAQRERMEAFYVRASAYRRALPANARADRDFWASFIKDIDQYRAKDPRSGLSRLEGFLTMVTDSTSPRSCAARLSAAPTPLRPIGFFDHRYAELHRALLANCQMESLEGFAQRWSAFSQDFNRTLANRRPLAALTSEMLANESGQPLAADRAAMKRLLESTPVLNGKLSLESLPPGQRDAIQGFLTQWEGIRRLLLPLYSPETGQVPGLAVTVTLRDHPQQETEGNKIASWTFGIGRQSVETTGRSEKPMIWRPGDDTRLVLRFADQSPLIPSAVKPPALMRVSGRTVSLRLGGPWSIFDMVAVFKSSVIEEADPGKITLVFTIPLVPADQPNALSTQAATVFVGLSFSAPGSQAPLAWPKTFAIRAPSLAQRTGEARD